MPRNPSYHLSRQIYNPISRGIIKNLIYPLDLYLRCESEAFVREGLHKAYAEKKYLPTKEMISLGKKHQLSNIDISALDEAKKREKTARFASANLRSSKELIKQIQDVSGSVKPILYYYGGLNILDFLTSVLCYRDRRGSPGHGLKVTCEDDGWNFNKDWVKEKCQVEIQGKGDFPFFVDAFTYGGWPSLFSGFGLRRLGKDEPYELIENPYPVGKAKMSLFELCNFDFYNFINAKPNLKKWVEDISLADVVRNTSLLMDYIVVYFASTLARYYIPAWNSITEAVKSDIYNDIQLAYDAVIEIVPYIYATEGYYKYTFGTIIEPASH